MLGSNRALDALVGAAGGRPGRDSMDTPARFDDSADLNPGGVVNVQRDVRAL